jgi:hypothetical protein
MFACVCVLNACTPQKLSPKKLAEYIQDESKGLKKVQTVGNVEYTLTYRPSDLLVWKEIENEKEVTDSLVQKLKNNYQQYDYYILDIRVNGKDALHSGSANMQQFSQNLQTLSFHMAEHTYGVTEKTDTIPLADYYSPRMYGMGNSTQVMLAYNRQKDPGAYIEIYIEDIGLGTGRQIFQFKKEDIEKTPSVEFGI